MLIGMEPITAPSLAGAEHGRYRGPSLVSGSYLTFAARRLAAAVLIAALVSAITFVMLRVLRPESFFDPRPLPTAAR